MIWRKDIHGQQLKEGDIVAEGKVGDTCWRSAGSEGKLVRRPLGIVVTYKTWQDTMTCPPEECDRYNITQIRTGLVELNDKMPPWLLENSFKIGEKNFAEIHLSRYDGNFKAWKNIEIIGSIYDLDSQKQEEPLSVESDNEAREKEGYSSAFCQCGRTLRIKTPLYRKFYDLKCPICGFTVKLYAGEI